MKGKNSDVLSISREAAYVALDALKFLRQIQGMPPTKAETDIRAALQAQEKNDE